MMKGMKKKGALPIALLLAVMVCCCLFTALIAGAETTPVIKTSDDMVQSGKLYEASEKTTKLTPFNGVVASTGTGGLVYDEEVDGVDVTLRYSGASVGSATFFVLRANSHMAIWDGGQGYFAMAVSTASGISVQLLKGAQTGKPDPNNIPTLKSATSVAVDLFDGEKHRVQYSAVNEGDAVKISLTIDQTEVFTVTDDGSIGGAIYEKENRHYMMCGGTAFKLYAADGEDFDISTAETDYITLTSKTMLKEASNWQLDGVSFTQEGISPNSDKGKAMFGRELSNVMYSFDISISDLGGNWVMAALNTNVADVPWNAGFRSMTIFFNAGTVSLEYWNGAQTPIASFAYPAGTDIADMHVECGLYTIELSTGKYTFAKIAINGTELYNEPILTENVSLGAGHFALINYGTARYVFKPTENEVDPLPMFTDGVSELREDESTMTQNIGTDDWAVIANSFNPRYSLEDDGAFRMQNNGYVTYKNSVDFDKLSFSLRFDAGNKLSAQTAEFAFGKRRQDSYPGIPLTDDSTNYGYGLKILPSGMVLVVKMGTGKDMRTLMTLDYGSTFNDNAYHKFTVYRSATETTMKITVFVDDSPTGYSVVDSDRYEPNYPMDGFLSFGNTALDSGILVKDFVYSGTETDVASTLKADAVNFVTCFERDDRKFVYFCFDSASYTTKWAEIYASDAQGVKGDLLGTVYAGGGAQFDITDYEGEYVLVVSVGFTEAGNKQTLLKTTETPAPVQDVTDVQRIKIRESEDGAYFTYGDTDKKYIPMGANYMGLRGGDHSTFDAATTFTEADYDPVKSEAMMKAVAANGGNFLRVFLIGRTSINPGISGDASYDINDETYYYEGLYKPYMENVVHFLRTAQKYGIYVMLTLGDADVPSNAYYYQLQGGSNLARNYMYMDSRGVAARTAYARNVVSYFHEFAPDCISGILSIALQNEFAVYGDHWPFDNATTGRQTLANGETYDMDNVDEREAAYRESVLYYLNEMVKAIKTVDPDMLVNEGSFTRNIVGNNDVYGMQGFTSGDNRQPATFDIYLSSDIDYLDLHVYFANRNNNTVMSSFADDLTGMNFYAEETQKLLKKKPIVMGEFGPSSTIFKTLEEATQVWLETARLAKEVGIAGFCCWTLESHNQVNCWNILADDGKFDTFRELVKIFADEAQEPTPPNPPDGGDDKPGPKPDDGEKDPPKKVKGCGCNSTLGGVCSALAVLPLLGAALLVVKRKTKKSEN